MNKPIVALAASSIMLLSWACAAEVENGSEFTGADASLSPADVVVSEELMKQELDKPATARDSVNSSARLSSRSEAIFRANAEIEQAFALNLAKNPHLMSARDATELRGELSSYLSAAVDKDVIKATKHWNRFAYKLVSLPPQRSGLALAGDGVTQLVPGILEVVVEMVTAISTQNPAAIIGASLKIVGLVFQGIQAFS